MPAASHRIASRSRGRVPCRVCPFVVACVRGANDHSRHALCVVVVSRATRCSASQEWTGATPGSATTLAVGPVRTRRLCASTTQATWRESRMQWRIQRFACVCAWSCVVSFLSWSSSFALRPCRSGRKPSQPGEFATAEGGRYATSETSVVVVSSSSSCVVAMHRATRGASGR